MQARNDAELIAMLSQAVSTAFTEVGENLKNEIRDSVRGVVGGGSVYQPNGAGSLSEAWKVEPPVGGGSVVEVEMHYDSSLLDYNPSTFKHASPSEYVDAQGYVHHIKNSGAIQDMASLVFEGGAGPLFGTQNAFWRQPRDAWTPFLAAVDSQAPSWILSALQSVGLDVS